LERSYNGVVELAVSQLPTPIGALTLASTPEGLCGLAFEGRVDALWRFLEGRFGRFERGAAVSSGAALPCLEAYFAGDIGALDRVRVDPGGSEFQRRVWTALRRIPGGQTASYSELACSIGQPTGSRAVATANATNPVAIVIPCHRVIHADGSISGYGGGVDRKRWLLRHEADNLPFELGATIGGSARLKPNHQARKTDP
jgi:methylated-DNA-[protein]-cysteine S-methyltransferase